MKQPKFQIGDVVFHITPESDKGVVLDGCYSLLDDRWQYKVTFGIRDNDYWYDEHELLSTPTFKL